MSLFGLFGSSAESDEETVREAKKDAGYDLDAVKREDRLSEQKEKYDLQMSVC